MTDMTAEPIGPLEFHDLVESGEIDLVEDPEYLIQRANRLLAHIEYTPRPCVVCGVRPHAKHSATCFPCGVSPACNCKKPLTTGRLYMGTEQCRGCGLPMEYGGRLARRV